MDRSLNATTQTNDTLNSKFVGDHFNALFGIIDVSDRDYVQDTMHKVIVQVNNNKFSIDDVVHVT